MNSEPLMSEQGMDNFSKRSDKKARPRLIAVVSPSCTGCEVCVDFCPVDCIDDLPRTEPIQETIPPIMIREEECIGCQVCAKVCEELDQNAIEMVPVDEGKRAAGRHAAAPALA